MNIAPIASSRFSAITGSESAPDNSLPVAIDVSREDALHALNPLQHLPVIGMIYRAATGEQVPTALRVAGAGLIGGPLGMVGAGFMSLMEALFQMGPDTSRPSVPVGMAQTGSEAGVEPVTPGTVTGNDYTTLATTEPDFLRTTTPTGTAFAQAGAAAYQSAELEWQRSQSVEKGLA